MNIKQTFRLATRVNGSGDILLKKEEQEKIVSYVQYLERMLNIEHKSDFLFGSEQ